MITNYTPGPWVQATKGPNGCPIIGDKKGLMICMLAHSVNESDNKATAQANAALIESAPDLLSIAERWAALDGGAWNIQRHASEKAELMADTCAAIVKAAAQTP